MGFLIYLLLQPCTLKKRGANGVLRPEGIVSCDRFFVLAGLACTSSICGRFVFSHICCFITDATSLHNIDDKIPSRNPLSRIRSCSRSSRPRLPASRLACRFPTRGCACARHRLRWTPRLRSRVRLSLTRWSRTGPGPSVTGMLSLVGGMPHWGVRGLGSRRLKVSLATFSRARTLQRRLSATAQVARCRSPLVGRGPGNLKMLLLWTSTASPTRPTSSVTAQAARHRSPLVARGLGKAPRLRLWTSTASPTRPTSSVTASRRARRRSPLVARGLGKPPMLRLRTSTASPTRGTSSATVWAPRRPRPLVASTRFEWPPLSNPMIVRRCGWSCSLPCHPQMEMAYIVRDRRESLPWESSTRRWADEYILFSPSWR